MATTYLFNAASRTGAQQRLYLDESGTLGYSGELFTMAFVLVNDLPKLEICTLKHRVTQSEVKASQMKTAQKLALARTLLEENDIQVFLAKLDPLASMVCERKLDKEFLYDSMVAQALACYLERGDLARNLPYRISMDMRGGLRESYEDMVGESVGNVLMHRDEPLVTALDVRFLDSRYSAGVQAADLFSNIYRTALTQGDSPCLSFLRKYEEDGRVHAGFTFGLPELADQMTQIASDLRARVELEDALEAERAEAERLGVAPGAGLAGDVEASEGLGAGGLSRSARRRRSRRAARERELMAAGMGADAPAGKAADDGGDGAHRPEGGRRPGDRAGREKAAEGQQAADEAPAGAGTESAEAGAPAGDRDRTERGQRRGRRGGAHAEAAPAPARDPQEEAAPDGQGPKPEAAKPAETPLDEKAAPARLPFAPARDMRPGRAGRLRQTLAAQKRAAAQAAEKAPAGQAGEGESPTGAPAAPVPPAPSPATGEPDGAGHAASAAPDGAQAEPAATKPRRSRRPKAAGTADKAARSADKPTGEHGGETRQEPSDGKGDGKGQSLPAKAKASAETPASPEASLSAPSPATGEADGAEKLAAAQSGTQAEQVSPKPRRSRRPKAGAAAAGQQPAADAGGREGSQSATQPATQPAAQPTEAQPAPSQAAAGEAGEQQASPKPRRSRRPKAAPAAE